MIAKEAPPVFHLSVSKHCQKKNNTFYPRMMEIKSEEDLKAAARFDHLARAMKNNYRNNDNFLWSDCFPHDLDNSHSEDEADWKTLDDVAEAHPDVCFFAVKSRSYMKWKKKDGRFFAPREKWHLYYPSSCRMEKERYERIMNLSAAQFPYFDAAMTTISQPLFGVENPEVIYYPGSKTLDQYIESVPLETIIENLKSYTQKYGIQSGQEQNLLEYFGLVDGRKKTKRDRIILPEAQQKQIEWFLAWSNENHVEILDRWHRDSEDHPEGEYFAVTCAWEHEHTEDTGIRQSAVIIDGDGVINYNCLHNHCRGIRHWKDFRKEIELRNAFKDVDPEGSGEQHEADREHGETEMQLKWTNFAAVEGKEVSWLVPGYIPLKGITILGGDGGVGKSSIECSIAADISAGRQTIFTYGMIPSEFGNNPPGRVILLNGEDPYSEVLKPLLAANNANFENILTIDERQIKEAGLCYSDERLKADIKSFNPDLIIFDPLQQFLPDGVRMSERNAMRRSINHALAMAVDNNCAVLLVMHTNKQLKVWGRQRLSDSSDLWDLSRSVLMAGTHGTEGRHISHEKSNFGKLQGTIEFAFDECRRIRVIARNEKRDREYILEGLEATRTDAEAGNTEEAAEMILSVLSQEGEMLVKDLDEAVKTYGISRRALVTAKNSLKDSGAIKYRRESKGKSKGVLWYISANEDNEAD